MTTLSNNEIHKRLRVVFDGQRTCAADRRYALALVEVSQKEIQEELGHHSHSVVSETIAGHRMDRRVMEKVSLAIGFPVDWIFKDG